jgi:hypothetical protein
MTAFSAPSLGICRMARIANVNTAFLLPGQGHRNLECFGEAYLSKRE